VKQYQGGEEKMRRAVATAILFLLLAATAAGAGDTVKKRMEVLEMIRQHVFAVHYDPAGPPHWDRVWEEELLPLSEEEDVCRFYKELTKALMNTGVSHLTASPPGARDWPPYRERLDVIHHDGRAWIGRSPAAAALGLSPGTEILRLNGEPYFEYYYRHHCGDAKKPRRLTLRSSDGVLTEFAIPRRWPKTGEGGPIISISRPAPGIGCLQVDSFESGEYRPHDAEKALKALDGVGAVIVDLRRNMGGHLICVRHLLSHLFNEPVELGRSHSRRTAAERKNAAIYRERYAAKVGAPLYRTGERRESMTVEPVRRPFTGPLVVLVGRRTASAAEIAARCLQVEGRAVLVGENSAGAVLPALALRLPDGGRLYLSPFVILDGTGVPIEGSGVAPDIPVPWQIEDLTTGRDRAMAAAVDHLVKRPGEELDGAETDDLANIEKIVHDSIGWAKTKDRPLLESIIAHDEDYFCFHPEGLDPVHGYDEFLRGFDIWMDERFVATRFEMRDYRAHLSRSGDVVWFSAIIDDCFEWDGQPGCWDDTRWTGVLEKRDDRWVIMQMHFSFAADQAATESDGH